MRPPVPYTYARDSNHGDSRNRHPQHIGCLAWRSPAWPHRISSWAVLRLRALPGSTTCHQWPSVDQCGASLVNLMTPYDAPTSCSVVFLFTSALNSTDTSVPS